MDKKIIILIVSILLISIGFFIYNKMIKKIEKPTIEIVTNLQDLKVATDSTVTFTASSNQKVTTWKWDFGDNGSIAFEQNPTHQYASIGNYKVKLMVTGSFGIYYDSSIVINVGILDTAKPKPIIAIKDTLKHKPIATAPKPIIPSPKPINTPKPVIQPHPHPAATHPHPQHVKEPTTPFNEPDLSPVQAKRIPK